MKLFTNKSVQGIFVNRINRFVATVNVEGQDIIAHVPNTGRMTELLFSGNIVLLQYDKRINRKTDYTIKLAKYGKKWVCIDALITNKIASQYIKENYPGDLKSEVLFLNSRFDFLLENENKSCFIEVKSVNLVKDSIAYFPDAPTLRGKKHVQELQSCIEMGFGAMVIFVVQRGDAELFKPHTKMDEKFNQELIKAYKMGLEIKVLRCNVTNTDITIDRELDFILNT